MLMEVYSIGHIPDPISIGTFATAGLALMVLIIVPAIIGVRRQERMIAEGSLQAAAVVSVPARVKLYLLMATITLVSVAIQILHFPIHRHWVLVWNLAAMIAVIVLMESLYRFKKSPR